jgi:hypothetical protein
LQDLKIPFLKGQKRKDYFKNKKKFLASKQAKMNSMMHSSNLSEVSIHFMQSKHA